MPSLELVDFVSEGMKDSLVIAFYVSVSPIILCFQRYAIWEVNTAVYQLFKKCLTTEAEDGTHI